MVLFGVTASLVGGSRPKSAGVSPFTNRKVVLVKVPNKSSPHQIISSQRRPHSSREPRPPVKGSAPSPRSRPYNATNELCRQLDTSVASRHNAIMQLVVRDEINEQRLVTRKAKRQLHDLRATIGQREDELLLAQRHIQVYDRTSLSANQNALKTQNHVVAKLKEEIAHQDAYKKKMRCVLERLEKNVRNLEASVDQLTDRRRAARREQMMCQNRIKIESDKYYHMQQLVKDWQDKRTAFQSYALPIIESYRAELASRLVITHQREDADRRRDELLRFLSTQQSSGSKGASELPTTATTKDRALPAHGMQRRESYKVLLDDADENKRETMFAVYEGQYERVVRETGEVNLSVVYDRFQSYSESIARLQEIENDLRAENARLSHEQQAQCAIVSRLRVSGPFEMTERRQRLRDRLERALHVQQLEKNRARERLHSQLKAFVYLQQGVLHIVELLKCLDDQAGLVFKSQVIAEACTVIGGSYPAEKVLISVVPALKSLLRLIRDIGRRGFQREWLQLPTIDYSESQLARLELAINGQRGGVVKDNSDLVDDKLEEERQNDIAVRKAVKKHEQETLRQAEMILGQTFDAQKPHQTRIKHQSIALLTQQSDCEIVVAHFREQRRIDKREHQFEAESVLSLDDG